MIEDPSPQDFDTARERLKDVSRLAMVGGSSALIQVITPSDARTGKVTWAAEVVMSQLLSKQQNDGVQLVVDKGNGITGYSMPGDTWCDLQHKLGGPEMTWAAARSAVVERDQGR